MQENFSCQGKNRPLDDLGGEGQQANLSSLVFRDPGFVIIPYK